jgi:hypothetical protein
MWTDRGLRTSHRCSSLRFLSHAQIDALNWYLTQRGDDPLPTPTDGVQEIVDRVLASYATQAKDELWERRRRVIEDDAEVAEIVDQKVEERKDETRGVLEDPRS